MTSKEILKDFPLRWIAYSLSKPRFMARQQEIIEELSLADEAFPRELRIAALAAVQSQKAEVVRCGLSALTFVGTVDDIHNVEMLATHEDAAIVRDARTCLFEIKHRHRSTH